MSTNLLAEVTAKDCVEQAKAASKTDPCTVLARIARAKLESADEPLFQALRSCGLAMGVSVTNLALDDSFKYPSLHPKDLLQTVAEAGFLHKAIGVPVAKCHEVFPDFWRKYQRQFPQHDLFGVRDLDFAHVVPYFLHGDGGRTYKKDSILILSMFPALGAGTRKNPVNLQPVPGCGAKRPHPDGHGGDFSAGVNLLGNTLANRFLFTAMKVEFYKKNRGRFDELINLWARAMRDMFETGFVFNGETWRIAVLGLTGDAPFLREAGFHNRSFSNVRKSATSTKKLPGICWLCDAGSTDGSAFEDVDIVDGMWTQRVGPQNPLPWDVPSPLLAHLLCDQNNLAGFYLPDIFHIHYLGTGKDFAASSLLYIMKVCFKTRKLKDALTPLNSKLAEYMRNNKGERCHFGKRITLELLGYSSSRSYPSGRWSKGADTAFMCKYVEHLVSEIIKEGGDGSADEIILAIRDACCALGQYMRLLFSASFWFTPTEAWESVVSGCEFARLFIRLAVLSTRKKLCLYKVKPKLHMYMHILLFSFTQFQVDRHAVVNPLAYSTFQCEDFVGRVAKTSRRVSAKDHGNKILHRYLVAMKSALTQEAAKRK